LAEAKKATAQAQEQATRLQLRCDELESLLGEAAAAAAAPPPLQQPSSAEFRKFRDQKLNAVVQRGFLLGPHLVLWLGFSLWASWLEGKQALWELEVYRS